MSVTVTCPICDHKQTISNGDLGSKIVCANCDVPFVANSPALVEPKRQKSVTNRGCTQPGQSGGESVAAKRTKKGAISGSKTAKPPPVPADQLLVPRTDTAAPIRIGRAPDNDVVLDYPMISAYHAEIAIANGKAVIRDLGSTNGTSLGGPGRKISESPLQRNDIVYFGSYRIVAARLLEASHLVQGNKPQETIGFHGESMVFGRDPTCAQTINAPMVSARHARLFRTRNGLVLEDLRSTNGTFLNGARINSPVRVVPGDVIGLGSYTFTLTDAGTLERRDFSGNMSIEARSISVNVGRTMLIEEVSLTIHAGEFVGLMGPSGAGKTTFMNAMNGYMHPSAGEVLFNGDDLYANYDRYSKNIGYVPQDDIIHRDLTVAQALYFSCRLRLPPDFTAAAIQERIKAVLCKLGLEGTEDVLIGSPEKKGISGGQRKRVNLAMELLTDPLVLFLDEPTSGLSSEDALLVMKLLRDLANAGKTILLTIHQPSLEVFRLMDNLALIAKDANATRPGKLVFYGPAFPDAIAFFNPGLSSPSDPNKELSPDHILRGLARDTTTGWAQRFEASTYHREYVRQRQGTRVVSESPQAGARLRRGRVLDFLQWRTLVTRLIAIKMKDTWNTAVLMLQAPLIACVIVLVWGAQVREPITSLNAPENTRALAATVFMMGFAALWFGCSNGVREIVGEWAIYKRERMVTLTIPAYVASKFTVLAFLCIIQCAVLLSVVRSGCGLKGQWWLTFGVLFLAALVGVAVSLIISAASRTTEMAIALVPIVLLPMIILGGMVQPLSKMGSTTRSLCHGIPSRWVFEGMLLLESGKREDYLSTERDGTQKHRDVAESYFPKNDQRYGFFVCATVLSGLIVLMVSSIGLILRWRDVHK